MSEREAGGTDRYGGVELECPVCGETRELHSAKKRREFQRSHRELHDMEFRPGEFWPDDTEATEVDQ